MPANTAASRRPLTKRAIDAVRYSGEGRAQCILWDGALPGFGLRVHPTGRKAFVLFYRTREGRKRLHTLGRYPEMTLEQARRDARKRHTEVLEGGDPTATRQRARRAATFGALAHAYLERHARVHKRSARDDEQRVRDYLLPAWSRRKAEKITRGDVATLHRKIGKTAPYAANRTLALVSHIFSWGEAEGLLPEGYRNPAHGVRRFREKARERWLSPEEVRRLLEALAAEPSVYIQGFFWLALLTGCRKGELLRARWEDVDLERALLRLPNTKADRIHHVPLSAPALDVLAALPREEGNPYVFPGARPGAPLVNVEKTWRQIRAAAGAEDARLHDLRRTVGSWMAQHGVSLPLIGNVLNHSNPSTTAVYARIAEESTREVLESHGETVMATVGTTAWPRSPMAKELNP